MSFELRKLEDVCDILDHMRIPITSRDRKEGPYPYYGANGIQDYIDDFIFDDELVLLAEDGGNFGSKEKPIAYRISGKTWVNNHAHVLKPKNIIDIDYLCYSLMYYDVSGLVNGATRQKLTQSEMRKINIRYRSLEKQRQMVFKIKLISNIISSREHQLSNLNLLVKSRFIEMFGDPIRNDKFWPISKLKDVTTKIGSGATPKGGKESYPNEGISFIRSLNVHNGLFEFKDLAHLTENQAKLLNNVTVEQSDVLLNITGASVARTCVVPDEILPARVNQHVSIIRCNKNFLNSTFINRQFLSDSFKRILLNMGEAGGATRQAITKQQLEDTIVIVPPITLQKEYAFFVAQVDKSKLAIQQSLYELETLKKSLMQQYFG